MRGWRGVPLVALSLTGCLSLAGLDKDYADDLGAGGSGKGGAAGQAAGSGGTGGTGGAASGGKGGSSQGLGGKSADCPPTSFTGLPTCADSKASSCISCVCDDLKTGCGPAYKICLDDPDCSKTIECELRECPVAKCEPLAGASLAKAKALTTCFTSTCAASMCPSGM